MKILVIEPEKAPYEKEIGDDIHDMQAIVVARHAKSEKRKNAE